jgi:hypothetical protein
LPPSSNNGTAGPHYLRMRSAITASINAFKSAFDTALYTPRWAGFVWLQGEFDGKFKYLADAYEANLTCLINDVRKDLKVSDLPIIIPMIDAQGAWQYNATIRLAEVRVTAMKNVDTLDTKGFPTDNVHYKAQGQVKIGTIAAERWLNMHFNYGPVVAVGRQCYSPLVSQARSPAELPVPDMVFDLSGRKINNARRPFIQEGVFIRVTNQAGKKPGTGIIFKN